MNILCGFHEYVKCAECDKNLTLEISKRDAVIAVLKQTLLDHFVKKTVENTVVFKPTPPILPLSPFKLAAGSPKSHGSPSSKPPKKNQVIPRTKIRS